MSELLQQMTIENFIEGFIIVKPFFFQGLKLIAGLFAIVAAYYILRFILLKLNRPQK